MAATHRWLKSLRTLHLYFGVFTAPALLFFAFTGGLQSLDLHEASRTSDYKPPAWLASLSHLHKKQSLDVPVRHAPPKTPTVAVTDSSRSQAIAPTVGKPSPEPPRRSLWPMKTFFVLVSLSLMLSTLTGVYIGWRHARHRRRYGATLIAGVVVPALLLLF
jgi:uncharacterized iron-regulated membrane protein